MSIDKHSRDYNTDTPPVPEALGDVYRPHDLFRDLEYVNLKASQVVLDLLGRTGNTIAYGLYVTQGSGDTIDVSAGVAYVNVTVSVPDSYATNPPTVRTETAVRRTEVTAQTNLSTANAVLDGLTTNYVKVAYAETDVASRQRIKAAGTYVYEKEDSFTVTIDTIGPTTSEVEIATFTGNPGGVFNIVQTTQGSPATGFLGDIIPRVGEAVGPSVHHPRFCLTNFDLPVTLSASNWPDLVPWLRAQRVVYLEGQTGETSGFAGTVLGPVLTLSDTPANNAFIAALDEDQAAIGSFTNYRTMTIGATTHEISGIDVGTRTIIFSTSPASGAQTAVMYPYRITGSLDARIHSWRGRVPVGSGTGEVIGGLLRRDRFQGHLHDAQNLPPGGSLTRWTGDSVGSLPPSADGENAQIGFPASDSTNGDPRTGLDTHGPDVAAHYYLNGVRYTA